MKKNITEELMTRCEMALMGVAVSIEKEEVKDAISYIASAIGTEVNAEEVFDTMFQYCSEGFDVGHLVCNTIGDMYCVSVTIKYEGEKYDLTDEDGVLCSVYNFTFPDCSELGYCFFAEKSGYIRRIG